jgi:uncharacterized membrane protein YeaQ/YmgE (transglycosylase-associated protein family)
VWLLLAGVSVGLIVRKIAGGKAYGAVTDMLLGITGAFAADWLMGMVTVASEVAWSYRVLFAIWGAAVLPLSAHFLVNRRRQREVGHKAPLK